MKGKRAGVGGGYPMFLGTFGPGGLKSKGNEYLTKGNRNRN